MSEKEQDKGAGGKAGDEAKQPEAGGQGAGQGGAPQGGDEAKAKKPSAAELKKREEELLERKPWLKPDYNGPITASQAAERGRVLRMKGMHPDGSKINQK